MATRAKGYDFDWFCVRRGDQYVQRDGSFGPRPGRQYFGTRDAAQAFVDSAKADGVEVVGIHER